MTTNGWRTLHLHAQVPARRRFGRGLTTSQVGRIFLPKRNISVAESLFQLLSRGKTHERRCEKRRCEKRHVLPAWFSGNRVGGARGCRDALSSRCRRPREDSVPDKKRK